MAGWGRQGGKVAPRGGQRRPWLKVLSLEKRWPAHGMGRRDPQSIRQHGTCRPQRHGNTYPLVLHGLLGLVQHPLHLLYGHHLRRPEASEPPALGPPGLSGHEASPCSCLNEAMPGRTCPVSGHFLSGRGPWQTSLSRSSAALSPLLALLTRPPGTHTNPSSSR